MSFANFTVLVLKCLRSQCSGGGSLKASSQGFTLAEVLITLGVIGVVAALTMPSLIANYRKEVLRAQFKKAYSEISQAALLLQTKEEINIFEYAKSYTSQRALDILMSQLQGAVVLEGSSTYLNFVRTFYHPKLLNKIDKAGQYCDSTNVYRTSNGIFYSMDDLPKDESIADPKLCIDINGISGPNAYGYDLFVFIFTKDGKVVPFKYKWSVNQTVEELENPAEQCSYSGISNPASCSYYALADISPQDASKSYWKDFLK